MVDELYAYVNYPGRNEFASTTSTSILINFDMLTPPTQAFITAPYKRHRTRLLTYTNPSFYNTRPIHGVV